MHAKRAANMAFFLLWETYLAQKIKNRKLAL
jgi:hypothetical protein